MSRELSSKNVTFIIPPHSFEKVSNDPGEQPPFLPTVRAVA